MGTLCVSTPAKQTSITSYLSPPKYLRWTFTNPLSLSPVTFEKTSIFSAIAVSGGDVSMSSSANKTRARHHNINNGGHVTTTLVACSATTTHRLQSTVLAPPSPCDLQNERTGRHRHLLPHTFSRLRAQKPPHQSRGRVRSAVVVSSSFFAAASISGN